MLTSVGSQLKSTVVFSSGNSSEAASAKGRNLAPILSQLLEALATEVFI